MAQRVFLVLSALVWLPYGLFCFVQPGFLGGAAGVSSVSTTGTIELRAMYGGLQAAIGALALVAVFRPGIQGAAIVALAFLCGGLGLSRLLAAVTAAELSPYTAFALVFEFASAGVAVWLVSRTAEHVSAPVSRRA